jgi:Ca2+-binding EF-hand superfamily protein
MFREKDLDVDGMMSYEEFIGHDTKMALAFKAIDKNGDGFLSKSEFRKICPNMTEEQVSIYHCYCDNNSKKQN